MGYHEERKARDAGEEAYRRGRRSSSNPHDHFGEHEDYRCRMEWDDGYRCQERIAEERKDEEERERSHEAHRTEQWRQEYLDEQEEEQEWDLDEESLDEDEEE